MTCPVRLKNLVRAIFDKLEKRESEIVGISALSQASFFDVKVLAMPVDFGRMRKLCAAER